MGKQIEQGIVAFEELRLVKDTNNLHNNKENTIDKDKIQLISTIFKYVIQ